MATHQPPHARVLIVDDHELARAGLRALLATANDLLVVAEAADGRAALSLAHRFQPDLILMDVRMPQLDGISATAAIKEALPQTAILLLTIYDNPHYLLRAVQAGAAGYVLKDATRATLLGAIRRTLRHEPLLDPHTLAHLTAHLAAHPAPNAAPPQDPLTPRETRVLNLLAHGHTNPQIAAYLGIATGTAKIHVERILAKLGVSDRTQAAVRAIHLGLVTPLDAGEV